MPDDVSVLTWGVTPVATIGILQGCTESGSAETGEARDEAGKVIEQRAYSVSDERQYEALIKTGVVPPKRGEILTVTEGEAVWKGVITASSKTGSNSDYQKYSVTAVHKDGAVLVPYTAPTA